MGIVIPLARPALKPTNALVAVMDKVSIPKPQSAGFASLEHTSVNQATVCPATYLAQLVLTSLENA